MNIGNQIIGFGGFQDLSERRHLLSAFEDLGSDLVIAETVTCVGEVRSLGSSMLMDGVALRASVFRKCLLSADARVAASLGGRGGGVVLAQGCCRRKQQKNCASEKIHCAGVPSGLDCCGGTARSECVCQGTVSLETSVCLRRNPSA